MISLFKYVLDIFEKLLYHNISVDGSFECPSDVEAVGGVSGNFPSVGCGVLLRV